VRSLALCVLISVVGVNAYAAHPQLLLDASELEFMRAKMARNSADWRALKDECDTLTTYAVQWPDATNGGTSLVRGYVAGAAHSPGIIHTGYNGTRFDQSITELGVCYQALKPSNPAAAEKYLAQAHNVIAAISQRPLTMTRQSDGAIRYALSVDFQGKDLRAGSPPSVYLPYNKVGPMGDASKNVNPGEVWTISGATGCTSMNGSWRISAINRNSISLTNPDGSAAPVLNANCSQFTFDPMAESGFALRFWIPALAKAYDWFYDGLSQKEKDDLIFDMNAWMYESNIARLNSRHPENNYAYGSFWALIAAYVATDGDNPSWNSFYTTCIAERFTGTNQIRDYWQRWMAGGGFGEGWQAYGFHATRWMMEAELAMKIHGVDWTQEPYNFSFVDDTLRYWMEFTTPSKLALDDNEYVYPVRAKDKAITEPVWIPLSHAVMFAAAARRFHSSLAPQFQDWYREIYAKERAAAGKNIPEWESGVYKSAPDPADEFLYDDLQAERKDWKTLPLMYRAWSGNYAVSRTDWSDDAVEVTLLGGPSVGSAGNGKTQFDSGSVTVQRGNNRLLVYGLGETARSGDIVGLVEANKLHRERGSYGNKKNSIFWAGVGSAETRNQGLTSRTPPPGQLSNVTAWASCIDRAEDTGTYTYWRASGLEANNAKSAIDGKYHQTGWTREVFFLRPKLVIVHDRTSVLNAEDDRSMFWTFGRNITRVNSTDDMTRYEATFRGVYRGAFTSVLPASPSTVSVVDHENLHFLFRVEVRPAALDHKEDNWMAVLDAADSARTVRAIVRVHATNADALQLNDSTHTVIAFAQNNVALPIRLELAQSGEAYIAGLSPHTNYKVTYDGAALTIAADDGSNGIASTDAGVLHISYPNQSHH
jgi:hypothetical protein